MNEESLYVTPHQVMWDPVPWHRTLYGNSFQGSANGDGDVRDFHIFTNTGYAIYALRDYCDNLY